MFSDGVIDLVERGVITGEEKVSQRGKIVAGFVNGTRRLYDFIDDNPQVVMRDIGYVNDTAIIRQNQKKKSRRSTAPSKSISPARCAPTRSVRCSTLASAGRWTLCGERPCQPEAKPIIALPSSTHRGESRIVAQLKPGAAVTTTRAHALRGHGSTASPICMGRILVSGRRP